MIAGGIDTGPAGAGDMPGHNSGIRESVLFIFAVQVFDTPDFIAPVIVDRLAGRIFVCRDGKGGAVLPNGGGKQIVRYIGAF